MRKHSFFATVVLLLAAVNVSAAYIVVLKNGTRYRAAERWTVQNGKAMVKLENGTVLQFDPALIDVRASEQANRSGLGDAKVLVTPGSAPAKSSPAAGPSLGALSRGRAGQVPRPNAPVTAAPPKAETSRPLSTTPATADRSAEEFVAKLQQAYENVGIFEYSVASSGPAVVRAELVADSEDQVFKAISATAFVMANVPLADGRKTEAVELYMKTVRGGSAGRFKMEQPDAVAISSKQKTWQAFFVEKVLF